MSLLLKEEETKETTKPVSPKQLGDNTETQETSEGKALETSRDR
jgi:hypothetical protein